MWKDALLITLSCTLFVQMGLSDAVQQTLHLRFRILSCPKCCSFWVCLLYLILTGHKIVDSVAVSFLFAYFSLWLALAHDALATQYNKLYEQITETSGASENARPDSGENGAAEARADEMPEV